LIIRPKPNHFSEYTLSLHTHAHTHTNTNTQTPAVFYTRTHTLTHNTHTHTNTSYIIMSLKQARVNWIAMQQNINMIINVVSYRVWNISCMVWLTSWQLGKLLQFCVVCSNRSFMTFYFDFNIRSTLLCIVDIWNTW